MNQEEIVTPILQPIELINGALLILVPVRQYRSAPAAARLILTAVREPLHDIAPPTAVLVECALGSSAKFAKMKFTKIVTISATSAPGPSLSAEYCGSRRREQIHAGASGRSHP